jgi:hypothetical protein
MRNTDLARVRLWLATSLRTGCPHILSKASFSFKIHKKNTLNLYHFLLLLCCSVFFICTDPRILPALCIFFFASCIILFLYVVLNIEPLIMVYWCWCQRIKRMLVREFVLHTQLAPLLTFAPWPNGYVDVWPVYNLFHFIHLPSVLSKFGYKIKKSQLRPSVRIDAPVWPNVNIAVCGAIWFFLDGYRRLRCRWRQQVLPKRWNGIYQTTWCRVPRRL